MHDIPILMLHTVNAEKEKNPLGVLSPLPEGFRSYLKVFKKWKYQMISMDDFVNNRYDKEKNFVVLTFDDGFKDNLTVALPILKEFGARGTIFVNPDYVSHESEKDGDWGFMTWDEIKQAEESGVFDIQAHTMTHEFIFSSDKVVDYYTPDKFKKYYWLAWMLYPDAPRQWNSTANEYKEKIPTGYPIFEYARRLSAKKFTPNQEYVEYLIKRYAEEKTQEPDDFAGEHGTYETDEEFTKYAVWEVDECKKVLEQRLNKEIHTLCFPGGGYTDEVLDIAKQSGYKCYMRASRLREGNNYEHLERMINGEFVGFNRTSFSIIKIPMCSHGYSAKWITKLSLGTYQNKKFYVKMKKLMSKFFKSEKK